MDDNERITPAWAGNRRKEFLIAINTEDHPRMGGE